MDCEDKCPVTKEEIVYLQEKVEMLSHKMFGGENPEDSLVTTVSQIKDGMDKFNRNSWTFMSIFGVLIIMGIFNSGISYKQLRYNETKLVEMQTQINNLQNREG